MSQRGRRANLVEPSRTRCILPAQEGKKARGEWEGRGAYFWHDMVSKEENKTIQRRQDISYFIFLSLRSDVLPTSLSGPDESNFSPLSNFRGASGRSDVNGTKRAEDVSCRGGGAGVPILLQFGWVAACDQRRVGGGRGLIQAGMLVSSYLGISCF